MRKRIEVIDAGNRRYEIWEHAMPEGTIYQVSSRGYRAPGLENLTKFRSLKPKSPLTLHLTNGGSASGFATREEAGEAVMEHSKRPYRSHGLMRFKGGNRRW